MMLSWTKSLRLGDTPASSLLGLCQGLCSGLPGFLPFSPADLVRSWFPICWEHPCEEHVLCGQTQLV